MQIPQIRMQSQFAKIAIDTTPARQSIQQPEPELNMEQPKADLKIIQNPGRLTIDQTQAWEELGLKGIKSFARENTQRAYKEASEAISGIVTEGNEMLNIQSGTNAYAEQARQRTNPPPADFNIKWIPSPFSVKVHYQRGKVDVDVQPRNVVINAQTKKPIISYQPGDVRVSLQQKNSLHIDFVK
ncbi:DUF6470 family protein [Lederbergia panacisoli]|uniref:DUF6470 family protein n=1 Tax=Lederbergia panacisoli TaxID=1255251 RepID=UPI00214B3EFE|nr:DUF6470 family protein [Lederbergia panacisoli]MCR2822361.1 DUF6470 family protein [Lederbergia panacisoli]